MVITCLPTSRQVEEVIFGDGGVAASLSAGALIVVLRFGVAMIPTLAVSAAAGIAIFYVRTMG